MVVVEWLSPLEPDVNYFEEILETPLTLLDGKYEKMSSTRLYALCLRREISGGEEKVKVYIFMLFLITTSHMSIYLPATFFWENQSLGEPRGRDSSLMHTWRTVLQPILCRMSFHTRFHWLKKKGYIALIWPWGQGNTIFNF